MHTDSSQAFRSDPIRNRQLRNTKWPDGARGEDLQAFFCDASSTGTSRNRQSPQGIEDEWVAASKMTEHLKTALMHHSLTALWKWDREYHDKPHIDGVLEVFFDDCNLLQNDLDSIRSIGDVHDMLEALVEILIDIGNAVSELSTHFLDRIEREFATTEWRQEEITRLRSLYEESSL
ncbi:hypothetical protein LTR36_006877 [Oleoguttula mirabilis]|uniref:Uncharacterized protein n=1 Tax=Oleoguttula mirabilis TaxID=1507867 RepID=A0AAV9JDI0_9PEZI|nr:hypothetical protein LTR36_006877 [Oleoguttula mirabilis]